MNLSETSIKRLGLISIINCEIEGMTVENTRYRTSGMQPKYSEKDFQEKANKLKMIVFADGATIEKLAWEIGETLN